MSRPPALIVVTGRPGAGKSNLARRLAGELNVQYLSRDEVKRSLLESMGVSHQAAGIASNQQATARFFADADKYLAQGNDLLVDAAFQHKRWADWLTGYSIPVSIRLIICEVPAALALKRFEQRLKADPDRTFFHGDDATAVAPLIQHYEKPSLPFPTLQVDTVNGYAPSLADIVEFCR